MSVLMPDSCGHACSVHAQAAAAVLEAFPPRGVTRLLPAEHTSHGKPQIERLVAEEYILDTIIFFEGDRVQCAQHLASENPIPLVSSRSGCCGRPIGLFPAHRGMMRTPSVIPSASCLQLP